MAWDATQPVGSNAASTIDDTIRANNSALDTWASALTDGINQGAAVAIRLRRAANATVVQFRSAAADTTDRFNVDLNGLLNWGPGNAAVDVTLQRSATATLQANVATGGSIQFSINSAQVALWSATRTRFVQSMARARKSANQAITGSDVAVSWDVEDYDTDTIHDTAVNSSRFTAQVTGKYRILATLPTDSTATARLRLRLNGTTIFYESHNSAGANGTLFAFDTYNLTAADYIEALVALPFGGSSNLLGGVTGCNISFAYAGE